jgi:hypothetical protein
MNYENDFTEHADKPRSNGHAHPPRRFEATPLAAIEVAEAQPALLENILFAQSFAVVLGESTAGKSFWLLAASLHISAGATWAGMRTTQGTVVYVAAEGQRGFRKRLVAAREHMGLPGNLPFYAITDVPDLGHSNGDADELVARIREQIDGNVALVAIDTLARTMNGADENSSADMGTLASNADKIKDALGCTVALVHHFGKDTSRGGRGSNALYAALDTEITIEKIDAKRTARTSKQKDGETGWSMAFDLDQVEVGAFRETTCTVRVTEDWNLPETSPKAARPLTGKRGHLMQIIRNALDEHGEPAPRGSEYPAVRVVRRDRVKAEAQTAQFGGADVAPNSFRAQLSNALSGLAGDGWIGLRGEFIWVAK